jgi:hypothetical protein
LLRMLEAVDWFCTIFADFPKNFDRKNAEKCPVLSVFRCFFCVYIRKCLIFNEKKFNIFATIILKSVAQFKKKPYICINKIKQY